MSESTAEEFPSYAMDKLDAMDKVEYGGLTMASINDIHAQLMRRDFTSVKLTEAYLNRIKEVNGTVRAVNCVNPDALKIAALCDENFRAGKGNRPLEGISILVKDLYWTTDEMDTTAGTLALRGAKLGTEASIVSKLRRAGAIVLGKANLSEWANFRGTGGWSAIGGKCVGPYVDNQDPQGSSCGSAVAVRLGLCTAAIGTETNMSITMPSEKAGIVGLKPTPGLTSRVGVIQTNEFQDTPGPMTSCVLDAALLLEIMAGYDQGDALSHTIPFQEVPQYSKSCTADFLKGKRVASGNIDDHTMKSFNNVLDVIAHCGAEVVSNATYPNWDVSWSRANVGVNWALLKRNVAKTFNSLEHNPHSLHSVTDLIDFIKRTPEEEYENWGVSTFEKAEAATLTDNEIQELVEIRQDMGFDIQRLLTNYQCDIIAIPAACRNPSDLGQCPTITIPMGFYPENTKIEAGKNGVTKAPNIPIGLLLISPKFTEEKLLGSAYAIEQSLQPKLKDLDVLHISPSIEVVTTNKGPQL